MNSAKQKLNKLTGMDYVPGMYSYADRYANMIDGVMATFREPEQFAGPVLDIVQKQMEQKIPLDKLDERRAWRDKRLASLAQMIQALDQK